MEYQGGQNGVEIHWYTRHVKNGAEVYLIAATATTEQRDSVLKRCVDRFALMRSWWLGAGERGELLVTFQGHTDAVSSAVFSPGGRRVLTASQDKTARFWDVESGKLLATFQGHTEPVVAAVFSPDG